MSPVRHRITTWLPPVLVTGIDVAWAWTLTSLAKPWFLQMLGRPELEAITYYDNVMEPRLWIGYAIVLATQLAWVYGIAARSLTKAQLRLCWWLGCGLIFSSSLLLRQGLTLPAGPSLLLLGVHCGDLLLLYWLSTGLMTPQSSRGVIPGWSRPSVTSS